MIIAEGTGEFLDAWLMLVEKMVNPKTVTESPHVLPAKSSQPGFVPFSPVQYLITTQKVSLVGFLNLHFNTVLQCQWFKNLCRDA